MRKIPLKLELQLVEILYAKEKYFLFKWLNNPIMSESIRLVISKCFFSTFFIIVKLLK